MIDKIEYYRLSKYIKEVIIKELIKKNSKISNYKNIIPNYTNDDDDNDNNDEDNDDKKSIFNKIVDVTSSVLDLTSTIINDKIINSYYFDEATGMIECNYKTPFDKITTKLISKTETCYLGSIIMTTTHNINTKKNTIKYKVNSILVDSISFIESKPVLTALVMTYLCAEKERFRIKKNPQNYVYEITSDNNVKLYDKDTKEQIMSVSVAIDQFKNNSDNLAKKTIENVCKELFNVTDGLQNEVCSKHFFSILGKSAISMLENMNQIVTTKTEIKNVLINANPLIKYEILKNLNWKMKIDDNGNKYLITIEEWLKRGNSEFNIYLDSKNGLIIREIISSMIQDINTNTSLLNEKYKKIITSPNYNKKKSKKRNLKKINSILN